MAALCAENFSLRYLIMSRSRARTITTQKLFPQATLVVPESQVEDYRHHGLPMRGVPDELSGVSAIHNWMVGNFAEDVKVMLCDDLTGCLYLFGTKSRFLSPVEIDAMVHNTAACCIGAEARLFGWSQTPDPMKLQRNDPFGLTRWVGGGLGFVGAKGCWDELLKCKCDVDACLTQLLTNRIVWQDSRYHFSQNRDTKLGGNSTLKTAGRINAEKAYLKRKWKAHIGFSTYRSQERIQVHVSRRQSIEE
jgi:hypothetical protein